jgi:hypothetical protein
MKSNDYTQKLSTITADIFSNMYDPFYSQLNSLINQQVLDHAHKKGEEFIQAYSTKYNYLLELRTTKTIERIREKLKKTTQDINFKANSDFLGLRVNVEVNDIPNKINDFVKYVEMSGGFCFERNPIIKSESDPNDYYFLRNPNDSNSKYKDIVAYVYAYIPEYEYIIEYQIGHKFAFYTFTRDSYLRDNPTNPLGLVDLWTNNFYTNVKNYILGINLTVNLLEELDKLYKSKSKPTETKIFLIILQIYNQSNQSTLTN